ncbi:CRISPR-associated helicase Cas3' [bacterium]|nr:CRISPR-associated helicase Cas3' [bacterium]
MTFKDFFRAATGGRDPYPYQEQFAMAEELPLLLNAPTGAGKTATAVLGWLWRRFARPDQTSRRLVYCLPMRVLVEQTEREAREWLKRLKSERNINANVHMLMGGVESEEWFLHPERPAILIGTQDMLLSRALNRGYAASRFHWPIDFSLLNNDCLWVFDEPQLMAGGVSTSAQLAGLRDSLQTYGPCPSLWMSATLEPEWLNTVDFRGKFNTTPQELTKADYDPRLPLHSRMTAAKRLTKLNVASTKDMKDVAKAAWNQHQPGTQTLVVLNTVDRAKSTYDELVKLRKKADQPTLLLVHSRFRPFERQQRNELLQAKDDAAGDRIIVATQVVEAGVDISARTLLTELCPWASLVQRFGRCNRTGHEGSFADPARVYWIDVEDKLALPYDLPDLEFSRQQLAKLDGQIVSPQALAEFKRRESITLPFEHRHVLRRRDLLDLFDTTPDLSGNDIDISRFVRSDDPETDVQVFWRDWSGDVPNEPQPERRELCSVPIGQAKSYFETLADKRRGSAWIWDHLDGEWLKLDPRDLRPGMVILLPSVAGGYSDLGWDPGSTSRVPVVPLLQPPRRSESIDSDPNSVTNQTPYTIAEHTDHVVAKLEGLLKVLPLTDHAEILRQTARWHDLGKAHPAFQAGLHAVNPELSSDQLWAKSGKQGKLTYGDRKHFRHELASALAALQQGLVFAVAYLIATHHGRVRLSIRSLPGEKPDQPEWLLALGVQQGDELPAVPLGEGVESAMTALDLTPMQLGGDTSWTGRALDLLADLGPFKLSYLETLLRVADVQASREEAGHVHD